MESHGIKRNFGIMLLATSTPKETPTTANTMYDMCSRLQVRCWMQSLLIWGTQKRRKSYAKGKLIQVVAGLLLANGSYPEPVSREP